MGSLYMKRCFLFCVSVLFVTLLFAQDRDKTAMTLRLDKFTFAKASMNKHTELLEMTRQKVAEAAVTSGRFTVIDDAAAASQINYVQNEAFMDMPLEKRIHYLNKLSNDFSLDCQITKCQITKKTGAASGYTCLLALTLRVVNTNEAELVVSESRTIYSAYKKLIVKNTLQAAFSDALESMTTKLICYFNRNFAVYGVMKSYSDNRLIVSCGAKENVMRKNELLLNLVTITKTPNGDFKRKEQLIGTIKVDKLLPDGTSLCKFTSDKEKVCDAFDHLDKNSFIQCKLVLK